MTQIQITIDLNPTWLKRNVPEHCAQVLGIMIQRTLENRGQVCGVKVAEERFSLSLTPKGLQEEPQDFAASFRRFTPKKIWRQSAARHDKEAAQRVQNKREGHGTI